MFLVHCIPFLWSIVTDSCFLFFCFCFLCVFPFPVSVFTSLLRCVLLPVSIAPPPPPMPQLTPQIPLTGFVARVQENSKFGSSATPEQSRLSLFLSLLQHAWLASWTLLLVLLLWVSCVCKCVCFVLSVRCLRFRASVELDGPSFSLSILILNITALTLFLAFTF